MSFTPNDIEKIRLLFEDGLKRAKGVDRVDKIKIRAKIRREISSISSLKNPTTDMVLGRWKYKLSEVFSTGIWRRYNETLIFKYCFSC
jgi:hypothetical protein